MKPLGPIFAAFLAAVSFSEAEHYQVYLLGGQSNGNGRADAAQLTAPLDAPQEDVRFYWHRTQSVTNVGHLAEDQWIALAPGSGHGTGTPVFPKEFGPEVSFGRAMADAKPGAKIAIIKYTHGGTSLSGNWSASGTQYTTFVSTVQAGLAALTGAGHTYEIRGMLWQQGEADTGGSAADNYQANLTNLISRVRTDLFSGGALPFVIGSLSSSQYNNITTVGSGPYKVRQAQEAVAAADPKAGIAITDGYGVRSDVIHFNHDGQIAIGQNFSTQLLLLEGPDVTAPSILSRNPPDNSTNVPIGGNLVATFNENISLTGTGTVTIRDLGPGPDIQISLPSPLVTVSGPQLIIAPDADLIVDNPYAIQISGGAIRDLAPSPNDFAGIADDTSWNFSTAGAPDTIAPAALLLSPLDNAMGVAINANLSVTFSENIQKGDAGAIVIKDGSGAVFESIPVTDARISVGGAMMTINPAGTFATNSTYHVQIAAGAVKDLSGNPWAGIGETDSTSWNFSTNLPGTSIGTTGIFDEKANATNQLDVEMPSGTLASFSVSVRTAYNGNLGGVIDWETGFAASPSAGASPNNSLTAVTAAYGTEAARSVTIGFDRAMAVYTNDINGQVNVLSQQGAFHNAILPEGTNDAAFAMTFFGAGIMELGAAMPARTTYGAMGVDFRATATFSGGGNTELDYTLGATKGSGDTFLHFAAPPGESIISLAIAYVDDNGQSLTNSQRRPILDDLGFIVAAPSPSFAEWISGFSVGGLNRTVDDADGDGIANGVENYFGTAPDEFSPGLVAGSAGGGTAIFTHPQGTLAGDLSAVYLWSKDLQTYHSAGATDGDGTKVDFSLTTEAGITSVTATVTGTDAPRLFVRVEVTRN